MSTSLKVILACAVLHNVAVRHHAPIPEQERVIPMVDVPVHVYRGHNGRGAAERAALIQRHFSEVSVNGFTPMNKFHVNCLILGLLMKFSII